MKSGKIRKSSSSSQNRAHRQSHFKKGNSSVFFSRADQVSESPFHNTSIRDLFFHRYDHGTEPFFKKRKGIRLKPNRDKDVLAQAKCDDCREREKQDAQPQKEGQTRPEVQDRKGGFRKTGRKEYYHLGRMGKWGNHKKGWYLEREYFELFRPVIRAIGQGQAPIGSLGGYNFTEEVHSIMVGWALRATNYYGGKVPLAKGNINAMGFDSPIFMLASLRSVGTMFLRSNVARGVTRSLDDLSSLRGATWKEAKNLIPKGWTREPLKKGEGIKFVNPNKKGEQILLEKGWPGAKDPLHAGPYMKISSNGQVTRIPLAGNPTLK